jgi:putative inorganic carbon (HCO3(-)) transporter
MFLGLVIYALCATTSTSGITVGVVIASLSWIVRMVLCRKVEPKGMPLNLPILLFLTALILSSAASPSLITGLDRVRSIGEKVLLYYLVANGIFHRRQIATVLGCLIFTLSFRAGFEVVYYAVFDQNRLIVDRVLGGCLGLTIPLVVSLLFLGSLSKRIRASLFCSLIVMVICLTLNSTRGAWIGSLFALSFLGFSLNKKVFLGILIWLISLSFSPAPQQNRAVNILNPNFPSNSVRIEMWRYAFSVAKEHFFLGAGPGSFYFNDRFGQSHRHAHNIFIHIAAEAGLLGLSMLIWLMLASLGFGYKMLKQAERRDDRVIFAGLFACLIEFLLHGMVDYTLAGKTGYLFWFYLGIVLSLRR